MKRQELRVGKVGEYEFQFWECWESGPRHPGAAERHWFRSMTGMEAATEEEMLQKLSGKAVLMPTVAADNPPEWDRRIEHVVRVKDKDVLINQCMRSMSSGSGSPEARSGYPDAKFGISRGDPDDFAGIGRDLVA